MVAKEKKNPSANPDLSIYLYKSFCSPKLHSLVIWTTAMNFNNFAMCSSSYPTIITYIYEIW